MSKSIYALARFVPQFEAAVLEHLKAAPSAEWTRLRAAAKACTKGDAAMPDWAMLRALSSPEELVQEGCCEAWATLMDTVPAGVMTIIAKIDGEPVLYCEPSGVYAWAAHPYHAPTLQIWVSAPAYPPGWFGSKQ
jgi:hypothetical protein